MDQILAKKEETTLTFLKQKSGVGEPLLFKHAIPTFETTLQCDQIEQFIGP